MLAILMCASALTMIIPAANGDDGAVVISSDTIIVTSPSMGEVLYSGSTHTINWTCEGDIPYVTIDLLKEGYLISNVASYVGNVGSYNWTIGDYFWDGTGYQLRVSNSSDPALNGLSDVFYMHIGIAVTIPGVGAIYYSGSSMNILVWMIRW